MTVSAYLLSTRSFRPKLRGASSKACAKTFQAVVQGVRQGCAVHARALASLPQNSLHRAPCPTGVCANGSSAVHMHELGKQACRLLAKLPPPLAAWPRCPVQPLSQKLKHNCGCWQAGGAAAPRQHLS